MNCEEIRNAIPLFLYGELSFDEEDAFEVHIDECPNCRVELARERQVHFAFDSAQLSIPPEMLRASRMQLSEQLSAGKRLGFWSQLQELFTVRWHVPSLAQPAGAFALVALGFLGARMFPQGSPAPVSVASLAEPVASRVRYVEPDAAGKIQIVVEETRQRTLHGTLGDERIQQLLLTAAQDPADPGLRVESMDLLKSRPETAEVRRALLTALQQDPNAGVRLKALDGLKGFSGDPEVRQTLARVLLSDKNPGVRTQVVDLLIQQKQQPQMVGVLQELMRKEDNGYVRMRCQKALHDMKASVETF
ncbi:MAG: HEAT repeat domain-containing protein [Acidobacteriaceae bacterium]|nr:HEAT repeat domain-containing protein [Acidobacteriaceae bacterium]